MIVKELTQKKRERILEYMNNVEVGSYDFHTLKNVLEWGWYPELDIVPNSKENITYKDYLNNLENKSIFNK